MQYYIVSDYEAPGGLEDGSVFYYDATVSFIALVEYMVLGFEVWCGSEVVKHLDDFAVTDRVWQALQRSDLPNLAVQEMKVVKVGYLEETKPDLVLPTFHRLVVPATAVCDTVEGKSRLLESSIPRADVFKTRQPPHYLIFSERAVKAVLAIKDVKIAFEPVEVVGRFPVLE